MKEILNDKRKRRDYQVAELITGCIAMFLFKEQSRNAFNNDRSERFKNNYFKIFKLRLPHMDTVDAFLRLLSPDELEKLKATLVSGLIEQKVLHKYKLLDQYHTIALDGTSLGSYDENNKEQNRPHKTSKNGITTYYDYVLEAKLVSSSGLAISIASEWVVNEPGRNFDKQDCELKAFERLAPKLKKEFPRLPICILADGLYPNKTFLKICNDYAWSFVVVLKDASLKNLQEDIKDLENKYRHRIESVDRGKKDIEQIYEWVSEPLSHAGYTVYWLSCTETKTGKDKDGKATKVTTRYVFLTGMKVDQENIRDISEAGRQRWKIENQGFNTQKNEGYNLEHSYSRSTFDCYKNYYQCLQIAHMINQFAEKSNQIVEMLNAHKKMTIQHIWKDLISVMKVGCIEESDFEITTRIHIWLAG